MNACWLVCERSTSGVVDGLLLFVPIYTTSKLVALFCRMLNGWGVGSAQGAATMSAGSTKFKLGQEIMLYSPIDTSRGKVIRHPSRSRTAGCAILQLRRMSFPAMGRAHNGYRHKMPCGLNHLEGGRDEPPLSPTAELPPPVSCQRHATRHFTTGRRSFEPAQFVSHCTWLDVRQSYFPLNRDLQTPMVNDRMRMGVSLFQMFSL